MRVCGVARIAAAGGARHHATGHHNMGLRILAGPGCGLLKFGTDAGRRALANADLVVDFDAFRRALVPDELTALLEGEAREAATPDETQRFIYSLRLAAIRIAREQGLNALITTSGGPDRVQELRELAGPGTEVTTVAMDRSEAEARLKRLVSAERLPECIAGLDRFYGREGRSALPVGEVEIRESDTGPTLYGVILQEGRAATGGRAEVFAPMSVIWPGDGIAIRTEHHGAEVGRAVPARETGGEIRIATKATPVVVSAVNAGRRYLSVEFHSLQEARTAGGVREIQRALVDGAALTDDPEYGQTSAEVRKARRERRVWL